MVLKIIVKCVLVYFINDRSALAKYRFGVAPMKMETERYENIKLEDETHVILYCPIHFDFRNNL
jgi:hypothetical protein